MTGFYFERIGKALMDLNNVFWNHLAAVLRLDGKEQGQKPRQKLGEELGSYCSYLGKRW